MVIKKIQIENYLCYYGTNTFELSDGLNIILGENGEGKTKFFEAIDWLFRGDDSELQMLVSAKKLDEADIGDSFPVRVSITVEQYDEKSIISRSFIARKEGPNECTISSFMIEGINENNLGERTQVDGGDLLDRVFPWAIRKYSMFKGEEELNIFKNDEALTNLINLFSDAKHYEKYTEKGAFLRDKAEKAVQKSSKLDKKNQKLYKKLEGEIEKLEREKHKYKVHLESTESEIEKINENLQEAERHVNNAEALNTHNKRIKRIEEKITHLNATIDENYTTSLFDENWLLVNFEPFHKEFAEKVSAHSKERRELQSEFDKQKGIKQGEKKAKSELLNNAVPLPIGVPSKTHMEEMLADKTCKVCGRPAKPDGTEEEVKAYNFMLEKLKKYLKQQSVDENEQKEDQELFKFNFTNRLENLSISHEDNLKNLRSIRLEIKELFEFNKKRKKEVEDLNHKLEKEQSEKEKLIGDSSLGAEKLSNVLKNYTNWQHDLKTRNKDQFEFQRKFDSYVSDIKQKREEKEKIDRDSAQSFLINTRNILRDIEKIFNDTKDEKFNEFIRKLQKKSNSFFKTINIDAFTGTIVFKSRKKGDRKTIEVELQEGGRTFYKPNKSLSTSMHISILFAISELAKETKLENYPMIFDAPTSSFGENKTAQFLNLIYETDNQKVLLIKDFLHTDEKTGKLSIKKEFKDIQRDKAFWVKLERPFDPTNLKTINSQVISL